MLPSASFAAAGRKSFARKLGAHEQSDRFGQKFRLGLLGVLAEGRELERVPVTRLIPEGARYTWAMTRTTIDGLWQIITGRRSTDDLGGPLKMAQIAGQQASLGAFEFIQLLALFSINLGFINLLPVPMLDGGHLLFYAVEAIRRRPVSIRAQEWAFRGGLALLLALLVFTTVQRSWFVRSVGSARTLDWLTCLGQGWHPLCGSASPR